jgi:peptidylprolyl isomerase
MRSLVRNTRPLQPPAVLVVLAGLAGVVRAQSPPADASSEPLLRSEITAARRLFTPERPIWVRLMLHNPSDDAVDIPVRSAAAPAGGVSLPLDILLGSPAEPALLVTYQDEKAVPVPPPAPPAPPPGQPAPVEEPGTLRLGPHAALGTEIDLRELVPALRYEGNYRIEWRPLPGRALSSALELRIEARKEIILVTDRGKITFSLFYEEAPRNVENFLDLVRSDFFQGKTIHKIIPSFLVQGGDPKGDGTGIRPDGRLVPAEFHAAPFQAGTLAMARKPNDPNSASCQFFITLARVPELDGQYTVIGQASDDESLRTLGQIAAEPTDPRGRPRSPLVIRSVKDWSEQSGAVRLELKPRRTAASTLPRHTADHP